MNDLEIVFSSEDLLKPTTARILQVFEKFADQLIGHYEFQSFSADMLDHPEIARGFKFFIYIRFDYFVGVLSTIT
jgi:hypothetical protein